jgi:endoglucanase
MNSMKRFGLFLLLLFPLWAPAQTNQDAFATARRLGRGVNILGYDRIWENRAQGRFQPHYFRRLKEAGFDHVRLNLMPFRQMNPTNGWAIQPVWFETLDWVLGLAHEQQLGVILDLHEFTVLGKDPAAHREQFLAFWRQVAAHCAHAPDSVLFEVLNEPSEKLTPALWNEYFRDALAIIREKNPTRTVVVGPGFWNAIDQLPQLKLPANDRQLLVTIHYYQPFAFTHQGAAWVNRTDKVGVDWAGTEAERQAIRDDFARAATWAKQQNRPLYLGEFGAYDKGAMAARARYTDAVARAAEAQGWSWAYWQFMGDFIVFDTRRDAWVEPILQALIPAKR